MQYYAVVGMMAVALIAIYGFYAAFKKAVKTEFQENNKPINDINKTLVSINKTLERIDMDDRTRDRRISNHGQQIDELIKKQVNIDTRLSAIEKKMGMN